MFLTRDSVHPGDDPPHHWDFTVDPTTTLGDLIDRAVDYPYRIDGSSWSAALQGAPADEAPIATVSVHWAKPRFTNESDRQLRLDSVAAAPGELSLYFRCHPGTVPVEEMEEFEPVPVEGTDPGPLSKVPLLMGPLLMGPLFPLGLLFEAVRWCWER